MIDTDSSRKRRRGRSRPVGGASGTLAIDESLSSMPVVVEPVAAETGFDEILPSLSPAHSRAATVPWTGWLLLIASILLETAGQLCLKLGAGQADTGLSNLDIVGEAALNGWSILGYCCMALQFPVWLGVLARLDLSLAFPLGSLSQITILLASVLILGESATLYHVMGVAAILVGTLLILGEEEKC